MRIILEGISGAGKTSQVRSLKRRLGGAASVEVIAEFSRGPIGRAIRRQFGLQQERFARFHRDESFADQTHLFLLGDTLAKAEEMSRSTADLLLVDRLFDSWLCYTLAAGNRRSLGDEAVCELHRRCSEEYQSGEAVTVFLDLEVPTALERLANRDGFGFAAADRQRLEAVARSFADLYRGTSVLRVDASRPLAEVTTAILEASGRKF